MLPRDFFRRNIVLSFPEDAIGIRPLDLIGVDPRSRKILAESRSRAWSGVFRCGVSVRPNRRLSQVSSSVAFARR
jgi:hypothetical protein